MCVLGTKLRLSVRVASALKHRTIYLATEFISYDDKKASNKQKHNHRFQYQQKNAQA